MVRILRNLRIDEISAVDKGAGEGCRVMLYKRDDTLPEQPQDALPEQPQDALLFNDIMLRKAIEPRVDDDEQRTNTIPDDKKLSAKLDEIAAEMIIAAPSLHPQRARRWLLHTPQGRELLAQHTTKKETPMPQVDIMKAITVMEDVLMAQVTKRDGESYAKSFSRKFENDQTYREQWRDLTEAKHSMALGKGTATLTPTSTSVGNTNVADDSAEAVRLLNEMAEKQHRTFEAVFADPNNKALAGRTYTGAHRPNTSSPSYAEMQRG
jgi:hypothetical protein